MLALLFTLLWATAPQSVTTNTWITIETTPDNAVMGFRPGTKQTEELTQLFQGRPMAVRVGTQR